MYDSWTDRARKVMQLANQEQQARRHYTIDTIDILVGLLKEGSGVAACALKHFSLDTANIRAAADKITFRPSGDGPKDIPQTRQTKRVIKYATEEARNLNHNSVDTEHILLGLLRVRDGVAAWVLEDLGLKLEDVREEVLRLLGAEPAHPPADLEPYDVFWIVWSPGVKRRSSPPYRSFECAAQAAREYAVEFPGEPFFPMEARGRAIASQQWLEPTPTREGT